MAQGLERSVGVVSFGQRMVASPAFAALYHEGMQLIEQTAAYLDGPGRDEHRKLDRARAHAFADESRRLTSRLMQLASWLLLQRAVNEGEMSPADARREKVKVALKPPEPVEEELMHRLPARLAGLVAATRDLQLRVLSIDAALCWPGGDAAPESPAPAFANPVSRQIRRLQLAFERR